MSEQTPHPANAPGDFYVEANCCTMCGVPFVEAPDLFGMWEDEKGPWGCFVKRQPETAEEVQQMINTIAAAELGCIRYRGRDREIRRRLEQIGEGDVCDRLQDGG